MEWLTDTVCWFPEPRVLINWVPGSVIQYGTGVLSYVWWKAALVLTADKDDVMCLIVNKDRHGDLSQHKPILDQIFQEYELDARHFRGRVILTESELTRWRLLAP